MKIKHLLLVMCLVVLAMLLNTAAMTDCWSLCP